MGGARAGGPSHQRGNDHGRIPHDWLPTAALQELQVILTIGYQCCPSRTSGNPHDWLPTAALQELQVILRSIVTHLLPFKGQSYPFTNYSESVTQFYPIRGGRHTIGG